MNLGLGQTTWNRFMAELGLFLGVYKVLRNEKRRYSTKRNRLQLRQVGNGNGFTNGFVLTGVKLGVNTDVKGRIFVRITDGTPNTVSLYKATGGGSGNKVAEGTAADNGTVTLAEANSSGISGTVPIGVVSANESDDKHYLEVYPDWGLRASALWDGSVNEDFASLKAFNDMLPFMEQLVDSQIAVLKASASNWLANRGKILMQSGQTKAIDSRVKSDGGVVITSYAGLLEDIRRNMADETTPSAQTVVKNARTAGSPTFSSDNNGQGSASAPVVTEFAPIGTITAVCSADSSIARQLFDLSLTDPDGNTVTAETQLQVGKTFSDPNLGIFGLLVSPSYSYDAANDHDFATPADWSFEGQSDSNTNDGVLYFKIVAGTTDPTKKAIEVYKSSSYANNQLVAKTDEGADGDVVALKQRNSSGLTGIGKIGSSTTAGHTCTFNLNPFRAGDDEGGIADEFTIAVTSTSRGDFQEGIAQLFDFYLNSATSGSETIDEGLLSRGTFPAFETLD